MNEILLSISNLKFAKETLLSSDEGGSGCAKWQLAPFNEALFQKMCVIPSGHRNVSANLDCCCLSNEWPQIEIEKLSVCVDEPPKQKTLKCHFCCCDQNTLSSATAQLHHNFSKAKRTQTEIAKIVKKGLCVFLHNSFFILRVFFSCL